MLSKVDCFKAVFACAHITMMPSLFITHQAFKSVIIQGGRTPLTQLSVGTDLNFPGASGHPNKKKC
ncbi:hypothetical protein GHT06_021253 [Daphnia sinensis]|uniref:Uncharacterized protein n=1 Tax=Daphnia sinensis TaxID=1820382 RepID=A0AAD5L147_9CRUS|nr:hypothetical protein GHT06_021253 [Daphnia sinensis]